MMVPVLGMSKGKHHKQPFELQTQTRVEEHNRFRNIQYMQANTKL